MDVCPMTSGHTLTGDRTSDGDGRAGAVLALALALEAAPEARSALERRVQCRHHARAELQPHLGRDLVAGLLERPPAPVGPVARHRVEGVRDGQDPGGERDVLAREAVRIAEAVEALVVVAHHLL